MTVQPALARTATPPPAYDVRAPTDAAPVSGTAPGRRLRAVHGRPGDPGWARPALLALLAGTALLCLWDLGASGNANSFYAAAVQAGTQSWKAMFFGSLDAGNAITVDKPAFFLWPMELAARVFGFNSWSMLVPQALEGVAAVGLLAGTVRRTSGHAAGLLAGLALALTPVAALMFRFNNPDAMLTLLLVGVAYAVVRALEAGSGRWLALAGVLVGLGFITKMGQALLVVPALGVAYLVAAPTSLRRRLLQLVGAGVAMVAGGGWYVAIVDLWPASSRPYIGGSTNNSLLQLAFGYNGLGRLFGTGSGNDGGAPGGAVPDGAGLRGMNGGFGGATGIRRLFRSDMATEVSWLLPTALLALLVGLWLTRRAPRTDLNRAALLLFGTWMLVTVVVFSYMRGTIHPYYLVALAPALAAVVAVTGRLLWQTRGRWPSRLAAAVLLEVTVLWDVHLLEGTPTFLPWLKVALVLASVAVVVGLLAARALRRGAVVLGAAAVLTGLAGSTAYAVETAHLPHAGSIPSSGPVAGAMGGPGGGFGAGPGGVGAGSDRADTASPALTALLRSTGTRWAAATVGSQSAAPLQLASGTAVMSIGGFTGSDAAPTLTQFQQFVATGQVRYFVNGGGGASGPAGLPGPGLGAGRPGAPGGGTGSTIMSWVAAHFTAQTVGGATVYDLSRPTA